MVEEEDDGVRSLDSGAGIRCRVFPPVTTLGGTGRAESLVQRGRPAAEGYHPSPLGVRPGVGQRSSPEGGALGSAACYALTAYGMHHGISHRMPVRWMPLGLSVLLAAAWCRVFFSLGRPGLALPVLASLLLTPEGSVCIPTLVL